MRLSQVSKVILSEGFGMVSFHLGMLARMYEKESAYLALQSSLYLEMVLNSFGSFSLDSFFPASTVYVVPWS